jgi:hypothetical protein
MAASNNSQFAIRNSQLKRVIGYIFALAVLFFLGKILVQTWGEIAASGFQFEFDVPSLLASLGLLVVARAFAVEAWRRVVLSLGDYLDFGFSVRVWFLSNLARYIPGNIWQVATMMVMVGERGVSKTNALLSQVIYTALALAIAGLFGVMFVLVRPDLFSAIVPSSVAASAPIIAALAFAALVVVFALPITNRGIVALTARVLRREIIAPTPTFARGLIPPLFSMLMWLANGVAFYLFVSSITSQSLAQLPAFIAMNAGAYWIGYVSFITPSGLGFREGALVLMLATFFPTPVAVVLSLATRLWSTAGELLGVTLVWIAQPRGVSQ